jgi:hypothetical protein
MSSDDSCYSNKPIKTNKKKKIQIDLNLNNNFDKLTQKSNDELLQKTNNNILPESNIYIFTCSCKKHEDDENKIIFSNEKIININYLGKIKNGDYIGLNYISQNFLDCAILISSDCITQSIAVHIKSFHNCGIYSVRLYINGKPTQFITSILDGSNILCEINNYNVQINKFDLIAFRVEISDDNELNGILMSFTYINNYSSIHNN